MPTYLYITTPKQKMAIRGLSINIDSVIKPMRAGSIRERTNRALESAEVGLHDVFIDLPAMWLESIYMRIDNIAQGDPIMLSSSEAQVLIDLINFLHTNDIYVGDFESVRRILTEISHTDDGNISL